MEVAAALAIEPLSQDSAREEEEADELEETEEALVAKPLRSPTAPTTAERAAHASTHLPYRSWCEECVAGRRDNPPHRAIECAENSVPEVMMDYCYLRRKDESELITILVLKERQSRAIQAWVVPTRSTVLEEGAAAVRAAEGVRRFGHRDKVLLKTDNEPAIVALRTLVLEKLNIPAIEIEPQPHESQSNGAVENGVRLLKGLCRVHLLALEKKLGHHVPCKHPLVTWLVEHVADIATKYLRGSDGRTAYERLFGKQIHEEGLEFGERVLWRTRQGQDMNVLAEARWQEGLWLGRCWGKPHHRIGNSDSVWEARAVQRCPLPERWRVDLLESVRATPWRNPAPALGAEPVRVLPPLPADERAPKPIRDEARRAVKSVYIRDEDLARWGYTSSCGKCQKMWRGLPTRGMKHTTNCRNRIESAMAGENDPRWQAATARITSRLEDAVATPEDTQSTPVLSDDALFDAVFADAESVELSVEWLPIDHSEAARMDLYNTEELPSWPVEPEEDYMAELLHPDIGLAERKEANEILELFLTMGAPILDAKAKVSELYSPPRVTAQLARLPNLGLAAGQTFDLRADRNGRKWNFLLAADREMAKRMIQEEKPYLVIGSPPCTSFCAFNRKWNYRRMDPERVRQAIHEGNVLFKFALEIYELQMSEGRHFLHEHPASASSWQVPRMKSLRQHPGVGETVAHLCQYGLTTSGTRGGRVPAQKPTRFLSSAPELLRFLGHQCKGDHEHQPLVGGRAAAAAIYPPALCRAMLRGIAAQRRREGEPLCLSVLRAVDGPDLSLPTEAPESTAQRTRKVVSWADESLDTVAAEQVARALAANCARLERQITELTHQSSQAVQPEAEHPQIRDEQEGAEHFSQFWDEITHESLPADLTRAARQEELEFMNDWQVWDVVPTSECRARTGKSPLKGKWVDVNKGDRERPIIRCRWVAKEFATYKSAEFFAATPPLEALRMLVSHAASGRQNGLGGRKLLVIDARKAHLHAMAEREVYVDLPPEQQVPGMCARLRRCLYGTRDAPARWEEYLSTQLQQIGFTRGLASPCCYQHCSRDLRCMVHGDDFVHVGAEPDLRWIQEQMEHRFLVKVIGQLGGDPTDLPELRVLNRVLRWSLEGILLEADPRHQEILVSNVQGTPLTSPSAKESSAEPAADSSLTEVEVTAFRSDSARANYLGLDRVDIAYAAKELCRRMSMPNKLSQCALQRLVRYIKGSPRLVYMFSWQQDSPLDVFVDTDFAGCLATRRSTSGGVALRGTHLIKHWSSTQRAVTLSSAEAELYGLVKGTTEALGIQAWGRDLGLEMPVRMHADSEAAIAICRRSGIGRVRHLAVGQLWVQEGLRRGDFELYKVRGDQNPADILTKSVSRDTLDRHLRTLHVRREGGRAESAPRAQV